MLADGTRSPYQPGTEELREACRAMKGSALRQVVYAVDGSAEQDRPYLVTESSFAVELLQRALPDSDHGLGILIRADAVRHVRRRLADGSMAIVATVALAVFASRPPIPRSWAETSRRAVTSPASRTA